MVNVSTLIAENYTESTARTEGRKAERENLSAMREAVLEEITTNPRQYQSFLDLQAGNIRSSVGNVALSLAQLKEPTHVGSLEYWHKLGRRVRPEEMSKSAKVFVPPKDPRRRGYFMGDYYDVAQTEGKPLKEPMKLDEDSPKLEGAFKALLGCAPVPVQEAEELGAPAYYDPEKLTISVDASYPTTEVFAALSTEIALAYAHDKGYNQYFSREDCGLHAESVGYLVCKRLGVACPPPNLEGLAELYEGFETADREKSLNQLCKTAKTMGDRIEGAIQPRQQEQSRRSYAAR